MYVCVGCLVCGCVAKSYESILVEKMTFITTKKRRSDYVWFMSAQFVTLIFFAAGLAKAVLFANFGSV